MTEHQQQSHLVKWASLQSKAIPELDMLFAIPNGGARTAVTGAMLKREGVRPGIPDLMLAYPNHESAGLFIEMKTKGGKIAPHQDKWLEKLTAHGYRVEVCWSFEEAKDVIMEYLQ